MAVSKQEVIIEFNADTGEVLTATNQLEKSFEEVGDAAKEAAKATEDIGDAAKSTGKALEAGTDAGASGFKILGAAIAATGLLGLVTKVLQPIAEAFLENKTVAESLSAAMAGIGAVIDTIVSLGEDMVNVLVDAFNNPQQAIADFKDAIVNNIQVRIEGLLKLFPRLGEAISAAFRGDFSEAGKIAADAVGQVALGVENVTDVVADATEQLVNYVVETGKAAVEASKLDMALASLADRERDLAVETARQAANIEELKRQRDDERLSIEERLRLSEEAAAIDQRIADENVSIQEEKARLLRQEIELQGETKERLDALAEAEIAAADARAASAGVQTELMTNIYALNQEALDIETEVAALRREFVAENLEGIEAERQAVEDQLTDRIATIERLKVSEEEKTALILEATASRDSQLEALEAAHQAELAEIEKAAADEEDARQKEADDKAQAQRDKDLADAEALAAARISVAQQTLGALAALNDAFAGESEQEQKKAFERSKKIQSAQALISTYESAVQAFKSLAGIPVVGPALGTAASVAAIASGLAQVKSIQSQTFGGGATAPPPTPAPALSAAATEATQAPSAPTLDLSFLGDIATTPQPQQAYVISENVTTAQQANKKIQDQAAL